MGCLNLNEITRRSLMIYSSYLLPHAHTSVVSLEWERFGNIENTVTTQSNFYFFLFFSGSTRKTWTATRRSFFKRRKGGRSSSRESSAAKELASFSDMASLNYSDSGALHEVEPQISSYVRVERLDCKFFFYFLFKYNLAH